MIPPTRVMSYFLDLSMLPEMAKKDFAGMVKLRFLRSGGYPELSGWVLNADQCVLIRGR